MPFTTGSLEIIASKALNEGSLEIIAAAAFNTGAMVFNAVEYVLVLSKGLVPIFPPQNPSEY